MNLVRYKTTLDFSALLG